jgi:hypothetical protein
MPYATLIDGAPPAGAEVHALPPRGDSSARTIRITRRDGSTWYCVTPVRIGCLSNSGGEQVGPLPDGLRFNTGHFIVDRDDPRQAERMSTPDRIERSADQLFFFSNTTITAYGPGTARWTCRLPDANPKDFVLFGTIHDGVLTCEARHEHLRDVDGDRVYILYRIATADGRILEQCLEASAATV